jgi:hypothetical protein
MLHHYNRRMEKPMTAIDDRLAAAESELAEWCDYGTGKSHWNSLHGSVTGDYQGMYEATASADAAEISKLTAIVVGLRLLKDGQS